jgi:hypothetical protein
MTPLDTEITPRTKSNVIAGCVTLIVIQCHDFPVARLLLLQAVMQGSQRDANGACRPRVGPTREQLWEASAFPFRGWWLLSRRRSTPHDKGLGDVYP